MSITFYLLLTFHAYLKKVGWPGTFLDYIDLLKKKSSVRIYEKMINIKARINHVVIIALKIIYEILR